MIPAEIAHTRLKRIVQIVNDLSDEPLSKCSIVDLGCFDGLFSVEFALHGASVVGVEYRKVNIQKALEFKESLAGFNYIDFRQDDVRNISLETYGKFDAIICSGILYHLPAHDAIRLISTMYEMTYRLLIIDTHVSLEAKEKIPWDGNDYWGITYREFGENETEEVKANATLSAADNPTSFWFTRPSLINLLMEAGFSSVYECFVPIHLNYGNSGIEHKDRCTFVAVKDIACEIRTSPSVNNLKERWPEGSLIYG